MLSVTRSEMRGMRSSSQVPWPQQWRNTGRLKWTLGMVWLASLATVAFVSAFVVSYGERSGAVKYFILFGLFLSVVIAVGCNSRINVRKNGSKAARVLPSKGLVIPYSRLAFVGSITLVVLMVSIFSLASYDFVRMSGGEASAPVVAAAVFGLIGVFVATYLVNVVTGRIALGKVVLSPDGIEHRSWGYRSRVPWEGVMHVSPIGVESPEIWVRTHSNMIETEVYSGRWGGRPPRSDGLAIQAKNLGVDPALVYHLIDFYVANAAARGELSDESALHRLRTASFA